ncbi:hypothetical protein BJ742DRAFT_19876 [Cladochytrium replicatum]|nr:hypothetical protein BJ742DRAFT_19876 [Cladochytrium replicatum]
MDFNPVTCIMTRIRSTFFLYARRAFEATFQVAIGFDPQSRNRHAKATNLNFGGGKITNQIRQCTRDSTSGTVRSVHQGHSMTLGVAPSGMMDSYWQLRSSLSRLRGGSSMDLDRMVQGGGMECGKVRGAEPICFLKVCLSDVLVFCLLRKSPIVVTVQRLQLY